MTSPPDHAHRVGRERRRAVLLGISAALLLLVLLEALLRSLGFGGVAPLSLVHDARSLPGVAQFLTVQRDARAGLIRSDDELGYTLAPHYRSSAQHAGTYATDEWPWRGRPAEPAPKDILRVAVLGDSNPYGIGVETADTLPERLALELEARGLGRERLQVLNFGVPGYSTVQVERLLAHVLATYEPIAVVFYVAAWNDQSPASSLPDAALIEQLSRRSFASTTALADALRSLRSPRAAQPESVDAHDEASAWFASGAAPHGPRVSEAEIEPRVARMLAAVAAHSVHAYVVVPAHPSSSEARLPRVVRDRAAVRRAAQAANVPIVDADVVAAESGASDAELFVDFVHPAPRLWHAIAAALADEIAPTLPPAPEPARPSIAIVSVEPRNASTFGDTRVTVVVDGLESVDALPALTVGGAPLLDVERLDPRTFAGTLVKNSAGFHDVLVQSHAGVAIARGALELLPPTLARHDDGRVVVESRPGDRALVYVSSAASPVPVASPLGTSFLDLATLAGAPIALDLGAQGRAVVPAPPIGSWLQALVLPRGEPDGSQEARVTNALPPNGR